MAVQVNKVMTFGDTVDLITKVHKASANPVAVAPHYDGTKGEYDNLGEWFSLRRDGKVYGVDIPEYTYSNDPKGIKTRDNVGLVCQPATNTTAGRDDYAKLNKEWHAKEDQLESKIKETSAKTCCIASTPSSCIFHLCGNAETTSSCWQSISCNGMPANIRKRCAG